MRSSRLRKTKPQDDRLKNLFDDIFRVEIKNWRGFKVSGKGNILIKSLLAQDVKIIHVKKYYLKIAH